jgi:hypothetical protein
MGPVRVVGWHGLAEVHAAAGPSGETRRQGAGSAVDSRAQVITAAGAGSAAAIASNADLVQDDIALALQAGH